MEINSANFKEMASRFGMKMLEAFRDALDGLVSQECEDVFWRTVELGIENTMRAGVRSHKLFTREGLPSASAAILPPIANA